MTGFNLHQVTKRTVSKMTNVLDSKILSLHPLRWSVSRMSRHRSIKSQGWYLNFKMLSKGAKNWFKNSILNKVTLALLNSLWRRSNSSSAKTNRYYNMKCGKTKLKIYIYRWISTSESSTNQIKMHHLNLINHNKLYWKQ